MAKRKSAPRKKIPAPNLIIPRMEAESKIYDRIRSGKKLLVLSINNENDLEAAKAQRKRWNDYNEALLKQLFDSEAVVEDYNRSSLQGTFIMKASWRQRISSFYEGISNKITALESIIERLELIPEKVVTSKTQEKRLPENSDTVVVAHGQNDDVNESIIEKVESVPEKVIISEAKEKRSPEYSNTVFVVHGHDDEAKISVAGFIKKLGLKTVILNEQPNAGQKIIEKFKRKEAISGFVVVILTPDDIGTSKEYPHDAKLRAGQNVILGLGYFCGVLGRARVSVLVKEGVEVPSDDFGIAYTLMDSGGAWQLSLAKDMKSAGLSFDANRIF